MRRAPDWRLPSPPMVVAVAALFVALGGTGYAAIASLPPNSVGTKQLKPSAVRSVNIANGAVTSAKLAQGTTGFGSTTLVYNASGTVSGNPDKVGTIGPWTLTGKCTQSGTTTTVQVSEKGPGFHEDGFGAFSGGFTIVASNAKFAANEQHFVFLMSANTTTNAAFADASLFPTKGGPLVLTAIASATGGAANVCHASFTTTPTKVAGKTSSFGPNVVTHTPSLATRSGSAVIAGISAGRP